MASYPTVAHKHGAFAESANWWCHTAFIGCLDMVTSMRFSAIAGTWRTIWLPSETRGRS
jgi:hypothetical protein